MTSVALSIQSAPAASRAESWNTSALAFFGALACTLLVIDLIVIPQRFYDYGPYLIYLDSIYHFPQPDWFVFEGLAKAYLLFLRAIFGTTEAAIAAAHYLLLGIFLAGFLAIFRRAHWECAAIAAALFAPQLGLVTIRATPAYIVCAIAAIRVIENRPWALRLCLFATTLHLSAFLALMPIVAMKLISRTPVVRLNLSMTMVLGTAAVFGAITFLFAQPVFDSLLTLFNSNPYLAKYSAYAVGLADPSLAVQQRIREPTSVNHYIFLAGMTVLFLGLVFFERRNTAIKLFAAMSYVLYLALFFGFSPVPAFRFAPFLALPVLASIRFNGGNVLRGLASVPFAIACAGIFAVQVSLVID